MWTFWRSDARAVLKDKKARSSLRRYFDVMKDDKPAKFLITKKLSAGFHKEASLEELWEIHDRLIKKFRIIEKQIDSRQIRLEDLERPQNSFLALKVEIASRVLDNCCFCSRKCGINRRIGELGYCNCGDQIKVSTMFKHMGEEPELVPSGTIFTLGCTIKCSHCQNWSISQWYEKGNVFLPKDLARSVEELRKSGCRNVNLVGGEPTPWLQQWLETFQHVLVNVPIVWNSNSYYSEETAKLLAGFADLYLLDFKYGSNKCAKKISDAPRYWEVSTRNHLYAKKFGELIIRVLILPGHLECCAKKIFEWIAKNLGPATRVNVMFQYRPEWKAHEIPELRRRLTINERERALELAEEVGLSNFIT